MKYPSYHSNASITPVFAASSKKKRRRLVLLFQHLPSSLLKGYKKRRWSWRAEPAPFWHVSGVVTNCKRWQCPLCDITKGTFSVQCVEVPTFRKVLQTKEVKEAFTERKLANIIRILQ